MIQWNASFWMSLLTVLSLACDPGEPGPGFEFDDPRSGSDETTEPSPGGGELPGTDEPDTPDTPPRLFGGFEELEYFVGAYWLYRWSETGETNGTTQAPEEGSMRVELVDVVTLQVNGVGELDLYEVSVSLAGDSPTFVWNVYEYVGVKDGVLYIGSLDEDNDQYHVAILFDPRDGSIYGRGQVGYFSSKREESVFAGRLTNPFVDMEAVVVSEPFYDPKCERIAGVEVCDDEYHDYAVREYYSPEAGFVGFYRAGTSIFTGGGYTDIFHSEIHIGLASTNLSGESRPVPPPPRSGDGQVCDACN